MVMWLTKLKLNSVALVRGRTIPTERQPLVSEVSKVRRVRRADNLTAVYEQIV
jgi:hypothetical protein